MLKEVKRVDAWDALDRRCHSSHAFWVSVNVETREIQVINERKLCIYHLKKCINTSR
jgi:acyl-ACP thioesterase